MWVCNDHILKSAFGDTVTDTFPSGEILAAEIVSRCPSNVLKQVIVYGKCNLPVPELDNLFWRDVTIEIGEMFVYIMMILT